MQTRDEVLEQIKGALVELFEIEPGRVTLTLGGQPVTLEQRSAFPRKGGA